MTDPRFERLRELHEQLHATQAEMASLQRELADGPVDDVVLQGPDGDVRLSELFGEHEDLILSFNMGQSCAYCTLWADEVNGVYPHLVRRAAFVVISPEDPATQRAFAAQRGWQFPMVSHGQTRFAVNEGFAKHDGSTFTELMPGFATYRKTEQGLRRTGKGFYGPGDSFCSVYHFFHQLEGGAAGWAPTL
ncbi:MAG: DUF899 family protein [Myxococcota bacterium]